MFFLSFPLFFLCFFFCLSPVFLFATVGERIGFTWVEQRPVRGEKGKV